MVGAPKSELFTLLGEEAGSPSNRSGGGSGVGCGKPDGRGRTLCTSPPSRVTAEDAAISKASPWLSLPPLGTVIVPASLLGVALFALSRRRATRRSTAFEAVKTNPPSDARSSSSAAAAELV